MKGREVPLAAWRVHATASEVYKNSDDRNLAERHLALSRETIMKLANSLPAEEPLRQTFLSSSAIRRILSEGKLHICMPKKLDAYPLKNQSGAIDKDQA